MNRPSIMPARPALRDRLVAAVYVLLLAVVIVGFPVMAVRLVGWPLPDHLPTGNETRDLFSEQLSGQTIVSILAVVAWAAWAHLTLCLVVELCNTLTGRDWHVPLGGLNQQLAARLIAGVLLTATASAAGGGLSPGVAYAHDLPERSGPAVTALAAPTTDAAGVTPTVALPATADQAATVHAHRAAAPTAAWRTYQVQPAHQGYRDNLWDIAERHLGDGTRWSEIYDLSRGLEQPGGVKITDPDLLRPGWTLRLPADATGLPLAAEAPAGVTTDDPAGTHLVRRGETLTQIAQDELGDADLARQLWQDNRGVTQPDGEHLSDPDLIQPGWTLDLEQQAPAAPAATSTPAVDHIPPAAPPAAPPASHAPAPDKHEPPATVAPSATSLPASPAAPAQPRQELAPLAPSTDRAPATAKTGQPDAEAQPAPPTSDTADEDGPVSVRTAGGLGALLAAGLLVLLSTKRARQQRRRRPGQRIAMPPPDLEPAEFALRMVEDPDGLERVDLALRCLSARLEETGQPLPELALLRLVGQDIELHLVRPATLPAPFIMSAADPALWHLKAAATLPSRDDLNGVLAPYPSLVTLGHDMGDAHLLVDLEQTGALTVEGDEVTSLAVLAAIAAELGTSRWADDLQVTLVGCLPQLPDALGTGRVRHVTGLQEILPALERRASEVQAELVDADVPDLLHARTARGAQPAAGVWAPEILLLTGPASPDELSRLNAVLQLLPRVGVASVSTAATGTVTASATVDWRLRLSDVPAPGAVATLAPIDLAVRPQLLTAADLTGLLGLLAVADEPASTPGSSQVLSLVTDEPTLSELDGWTPTAPPEPSPEKRVVRLVRSADVPEPSGASTIPAGATASPAAEPANSSADAIALTTPDPATAINKEVEAGRTAPVIQLLGPTTVLNAHGFLEPNKRRQLTEIAAYLVLHPGLDYVHLSEAIWPGAASTDATRHTAISKLRRWLGEDAAGTTYLRKLKDEGVVGYRLHEDVESDWDQWQAMLPQGPGQADTQTLARALELVKGQPMAGAGKYRYVWADRERQNMISAVVDVAHELAGRALRDGNATLARHAAAAGLQAEPGAEQLWRDRLRSEWMAGDIAGMRATADELTALSAQLGDDLEDETTELLEELFHRVGRHTPAQ